MIRRILVLGSIGLALAGGARFALVELRARAWEARRAQLLELALHPDETRRPWEVRFESLAERVRTSPRFDEIVASPYRAQAWLAGEPRALDEFERVWLESLWNELAGLDAVLRELRKLPPEALEWHGEAGKLGLARELTHALCGRAWLALEAGDAAAVTLAYADALRLARATDDGSTIGTMIRSACEDIVLRATRAALGFGAPASGLRAELGPLLAAYDPARVEHAIRRELCQLEDAAELRDDPAWLLRRFAHVEESLALAREPAARLAEAREAAAREPEADFTWLELAEHLHAQHARRNVALAALALAEHRARTGSYPAALAELADLAPEQALDPLTNAPLVYARTASGARVGLARAEAGSLDVWTLR